MAGFIQITMNKSIKVNYIFNLANIVSGLLFPLITFPYASRILLADGIGQVNFFQSIIQYITLLTCLGIPMYAIREIAKVREDVAKRNKVAVEILLLHASMTTIGYVIVTILTMTVSQIQVDISLFLLLSTTIFFTAIGCEWFYQGIEDFKYITIRGLIVKIISVILLFLLVKTKEDILWYAAYSVFGVLGGNIFNFIRLRKYITVRELLFRELHPLRHLLPALHIFVLNLIISIYIQLNSVMLGFMADTTAVGLFTAASKLSHMVLGIVGALGTAMLPRLSNLIATGQKEQFDRLSQKAMQFVIAITLPMTVGIMMTAPYLIVLFCGETYTPAILTLQIISPIIMAIGMSNIMGIQILYPQEQVNMVIICTALGAVVNFLLNLCLIPKLAQDGASIATVAAEVAVTVSMVFVGRKYIPIKWKNRNYLHYLTGSLLMGGAVWVWMAYTPCQSDIINLIVACGIGLGIYAAYLGCIKDSFYMEIKVIIRKSLKF